MHTISTLLNFEFLNKKKFEDSTWVISSHKEKKDNQYNGQEKKRKDK